MKKILIRLSVFIGILLVDFIILLFSNRPQWPIGIFSIISSAILIFTHPKEVGWFKSYFIFLIYTNLGMLLLLFYLTIDDGNFLRDLPDNLTIFFMVPKAFHSLFLIVKYPTRIGQTIGRLIITAIFGVTWFIVIALMMKGAELILYYLIGILMLTELLLIYFGRREKVVKPKKVVIA